MMRRRSWLLVLWLGLAPVACGRSESQPADAAPTPAEYRIPVQLHTLAVERFTDHVKATGLVQADADITLTAEVAGTVAAVAEPIGVTLAAGAAVVALDPVDLKLALARAEAALARAEAAHAKAQDDARTDANLVDQGLAPQRQATSMRYAEDMSRAQILEARALRDLAARNVRKATLASPREAELSEMYVEVGEWVAAGTPLARVVGVDAVKVVVYLSELTVAHVTAGQEAAVWVDTYPDTPFPAVVESVSPTATKKTRTYATEIRVENTGPRRLRPGMAARVRIVTAVVPDALVVPLDAVADVGGAPHVFTLEDRADGPIVRAQPVQLGLRVGRRAVLTNGPPEGTAIVAGSVDLLSDGKPVQVVPG